MPRFLLRLATIALLTWAAGRVLHPGAGLAFAVAGLFWLVSRYDNHTGSLVLATSLFVGMLAILVVLLVAMAAMSAR